MVSFDVSSLFTNVPVDESVEIILEKLKLDTSLHDRTNLKPESIVELLDMCLKNTYFSYKYEFYVQKHGAAMGPPVSPIVANLYMEFFEELALGNAPMRPRIWKGYVDDTFCVIERGKESHFLEHLNSIRPTIKFTQELENGGTLSFLDCLVSRNKSVFSVGVYRKPTHTNRYLNFHSHHPVHVKRGIVRCLYDRARDVVTDPITLKREEKHLREVFITNNFPDPFIRSSLQISQRRKNQQNISTKNEKRSICIPYICGISEDIRRVCGQYNRHVIFKSGQTLRSILTKVKDTLPIGMKSNVVYKIPCSCGKVYIGETKCRLETRIKEHQTACEKGDVEKSAIAEHAWKHHHPVMWKGATVVDHVRGWKELLIKEALNIHQIPKQERINRDTGLEISACWNPIMKRSYANHHSNIPSQHRDVISSHGDDTATCQHHVSI
jgi:predicted GIY-YIG superfamily endonuclease